MKPLAFLFLLTLSAAAMGPNDITWQGTIHTDCTLQSLTSAGATYYSTEGEFTIPLDKIPAGQKMRMSKQIAAVKAEQVVFDKLTPEQKKKVIAQRKAEAAAAERAEIASIPQAPTRYVITQDATGACMVRSLAPGVNYRQSLGGGQ